MQFHGTICQKCESSKLLKEGCVAGNLVWRKEKFARLSNSVHIHLLHQFMCHILGHNVLGTVCTVSVTFLTGYCFSLFVSLMRGVPISVSVKYERT